MRQARRLLVTLVIIGGLFLLMQWIIDVPVQYPDHGLAAISDDLLPVATCLVAEIEKDPARFGVGSDFRITVEERDDVVGLEVSGWFRTSSLTSVDPTTVVVESDLNPLADGDRLLTNCGSF